MLRIFGIAICMSVACFGAGTLAGCEDDAEPQLPVEDIEPPPRPIESEDAAEAVDRAIDAAEDAAGDQGTPAR